VVALPYGSVCDGIGAAHEAWEPLGMRCAWTSEIDKAPSAIVDHRWGLPNLGDMTKIDPKRADDDYGRIRLLVGGTPCQSFSVAGLREGLADPRGNLALEFLRLADGLRPDWLVWENVPGCLHSNGGRDFGSIIGAMAQLGYGWAHRILAAQYIRTQRFPYAVPQRRRRLFLVGCAGGSSRAAAVLFDRESLYGHSPPRRRSGAKATQDPAGSAGQPFEVANTLTRRMYKGINSTVDEGQTPVVVFDSTQITHPENRSNPQPGDPCHTIPKEGHPPVLIQGGACVRRLTPLEVERLQGFRDDYTKIKINGKWISDSARYKALGNSMAVNCMDWIGQRILEVDQIA